MRKRGPDFRPGDKVMPRDRGLHVGGRLPARVVAVYDMEVPKEHQRTFDEDDLPLIDINIGSRSIVVCAEFWKVVERPPRHARADVLWGRPASR